MINLVSEVLKITPDLIDLGLYDIIKYTIGLPPNALDALNDKQDEDESDLSREAPVQPEKTAIHYLESRTINEAM